MARANDAAYWSQRMKLMEDALKDHSFSYVENMERQFMAAQAEVERQIAVWYQRFAANNEITLADAKRLLTSGELAEFHWTVGEYIAYGQQNALDGAWMKQLENASARVHISRLEALKLQIQQQAEVLYANQLDMVDAAAREMYLGSHYHTAFEIQRGLGVGWTMHAINEKTITKVLSRPWTADGQTFRDKCWTNKQALVNSVNTQLTQMIIRGGPPDQAIKAVSHQFNVSKGKAGRLIMTEAAAFSSAAQKDCFAELGVERYKIVASFDEDTCELCGAMDGQVFKMSEYEVGLTAPPFHPWCVLPDSVILSPDAEAMTKSWYSGAIIQITAANGRRFSVTPNHIMLTARGWVRAKNLVEGDKVIYYCGWDKFIVESDPTQHDSVPSVEKLFASLLEFITVPPISVPAAPEHLKGDVVKDSEISIVPIDSFLRNKLDAPGCKLLSDFSLVGTCKTSKSLFAEDCSMSQLLVGAGLAAESGMGGLCVADILLRGALTHHELVSLRRPTDYHTRLRQSACYDAAVDGEFLGNAFNTSASGIGRYDCVNVKFNSCVGLPDGNTVFFQDTRNRLSRSSEDIRDFMDAFPGIVEFEDIVGINRCFFTGHVYDISSLSTLYICNGFLSSNCRCCTAPYFEDMTGERWAQDVVTGETFKVPGNMTYEQWKAQQDAKWGEGTVDLRRKMSYNTKVDKEQLKRYQGLLGRGGSLRGLDAFQELKYYDPAGYSALKTAYADKRIQKYIQSTPELTVLSRGKQGKHIPGHNNYTQGRSYLTVNMEEAQALIREYAGTGDIKRDMSGKWTHKEFITADRVIGYYVSDSDGTAKPTRRFRIDYATGKHKGAHIIPVEEV